MKEALVFAGDNYYPRGGWHDYVASYDSISDAYIVAETLVKFGRFNWAHVVDSKTGTILKQYSQD